MHLFQDLLRFLERDLISSHNHGISVLVDTSPKIMSHDQGALLHGPLKLAMILWYFSYFYKLPKIDSFVTTKCEKQ